MSNLPKILLTLSAVVCAVALGALTWLAFQTTEIKDTKTTSGPLFPEKPTVKKSSSSTNFGSVPVIPVADVTDNITDHLNELAKAKGVVPEELLLRFKSPEALNAFRARAGLADIEIRYGDARLLYLRVRYRDAAKMAAELRHHASDYENIGANYYVWVPGNPPKRSQDTANQGGEMPFESSGLDFIGAQGDRTRWGAGVKVAVLDTGITDHPMLSGTKITHTDLVKDGQAFNGHGTAMASLIAGQDPTNGGVAPGSELLDIRVADAKGQGNVALLAQGIMQAVDAGARLINISLGSSADATMLSQAVAYAQSRGVIIVAAAGNEQENQLAYPAAYPGVISVAAVDAQGRQAYFSNSGTGLTIAAPGVGIISGYSDNKTVIGNGTSQAAAITTGAASYLLGRNYAAANISQVLTQNAIRVQAPATQVGAGLLRLPK